MTEYEEAVRSKRDEVRFCGQCFVLALQRQELCFTHSTKKDGENMRKFKCKIDSKKILSELYSFMCSKNDSTNVDCKHENITKIASNIVQGIQSMYEDIRIYESRE